MAKGKREKATDVGEVTRKKKKRTLDPDAERKADEKRARRKTRGKELPAEDCAEAVKDKGKKTDGQEEEEGEMSAQEERMLERKVKKLLKKAEKEKTKRVTATVVESGEEAVTPSAAELSLEYLTSWATDKNQWKFQKLRQTWLLQHMYDAEKVPDSYFKILLKYLAGLKGQAKDTTIEKAESIMRKSEKEDVEEEEAEKAEEEKGIPVDEKKKKRVRRVLKMLS
ncbi:protein cholesin isoform X1 [Lampetra planeri]